MSLRLALVFLWAISLCECGWCQFDANGQLPLSERRPHPLDTRLKHFSWAKHFPEQLGNTVLKKVTVEVGDLQGEKRFVPHLSKTTTDAAVLRRCLAALHDGEIYIPDRTQPDAEWKPLGRLLLEHDQGVVELWMGDGFAVSQTGPIDRQGVFYSAELAEVIKQGLGFAEVDPFWPRKQAVLSGKVRLDAEKAKYENRRLREQHAGPLDRESLPMAKVFENAKNIERLDEPLLKDGEKLEAIRLYVPIKGNFPPVNRVLADHIANDLVTLRRAEIGLTTVRFRLPHASDAFAGIDAIGSLQFLTDKGRVFQLHIIPPFTLNIASQRSMCRSWMLSRVVNDLFIRATGEGLSERELKALDGIYR